MIQLFICPSVTTSTDSLTVSIPGQLAITMRPLSVKANIPVTPFSSSTYLLPHKSPIRMSAAEFKYLNSAADIRIGDLWGSKYVDEEKGVTGILAFTERGRMVIANCPGIETVNESVEVVTEGQMKSCITKPYYYRGLMALLRTPLKLKFIYRIIQMLRIGNILKVKMHL